MSVNEGPKRAEKFLANPLGPGRLIVRIDFLGPQNCMGEFGVG